MSTNLDPRNEPMTKDDLQFSYPPGTTKGDNPKLRGRPDNILLNRHEWYEMLYFCNHYAIAHCPSTNTNDMKLYAKRAERLIQRHAPNYLRSQVHIVDWLKRNWDMFPRG